jgi:peptidoglycan/xylan/chitin deacetylase (PgdA/CDA1 family)
LPPNACTLTFDDGLSDHYLNVYPRLRERGISGLFFALARPAHQGLTLPHQLHFLLAALGLERLQAELEAALDHEARQRLAAATARYLAGAKAFALDNPTDAFKAAVQRELLTDAGQALTLLFAEHIGDERGVAKRYYLSPAQAAEMLAGGMHFGGHSQSHPWLDDVDDDRLAQEVAASAAWLARLEPGPVAFAYPYGGYDDRTPSALAAQGFCAAFTTQAGVRHNSAFHISRLDGDCLPPAGEADAGWLRQERAHG